MNEVTKTLLREQIQRLERNLAIVRPKKADRMREIEEAAQRLSEHQQHEKEIEIMLNDLTALLEGGRS